MDNQIEKGSPTSIGMKVTGLPQEIDELSVSLVVYRPNRELLARTLDSLDKAWSALRATRGAGSMRLSLVDNGGLPDLSNCLLRLRAQGVTVTTLTGHGNVGYGRGHNLAIELAKSRYHLILNPDIDMDRDALVHAIAFLDRHPKVGLLTPYVVDDASRQQYLCRRYPALIDLFVRGFMPQAVRRHFDKRLASYEMRDAINDRDIVLDPPIVSGCFMLFRTELLQRLSGFDPRYFLYFEDYDLSLRTHALASVAYVPAVRVLHHGGGAARKGRGHIKMFIASACRFYNRFGWKLL